MERHKQRATNQPGELADRALGIDQTNSQNVYLTMGDGGGPFKSTDGSNSWTAINNGITNPGVSSQRSTRPTVRTSMWN